MKPSDDNATVRIDLTPAQMQKVRETVGLEVAAIEFPVKELEQRIAPSLIGNHNETMLAESFLP